MISRAKSQRSAVVLLVEDSPTDILLAEEAFRDSRVLMDLRVVTDGQAALSFLRQTDPYADAPRPDLVLLDLNLPLMDGREVLAELKNDEALKYIPVVILTSSSAEEDILRSYGLQANCYIVKPLNFDRFKFIMQNLQLFWLEVVTLPPPKRLEARGLVTILLVEDNPADVLLITECYAQAGAGEVAVTVAETLADGLARLAEQAYDLVLLDLTLPDSDGALDGLQRVLDVAGVGAVVVVSGISSSEVAVSAVQRGAQDYLVKNELTPFWLARSSRYAIERHSLMHQVQAFETAESENEARERRQFEWLKQTKETEISARYYGGQTLRDAHPGVFDKLVESYEALLGKALEQHFYQVDRTPLALEAKQLSQQMGYLRASPRDVIELHATAMANQAKAFSGQAKAIKVLLEEGRLMALELMGDLAAYYRSYLPVVQRQRKEQRA